MTGPVSKRASFYIDTVTFCVEDSLFKVPRIPFEKESTAFGDMFLLPTGGHQEGESDDHPIHLGGIKKDEFEYFLSVLLYSTVTDEPCHSSAPDLNCQRSYGTTQQSLPTTSNQWTSVLSLATLWGFDNIRKVAIDRLEPMLSPVGRLVLGQIYDLDFESWSLPAMNDIVRRENPISLEEAGRMGLEMTVKLASVREQVSSRSRGSGTEVVLGRRANVEALDFKPILRETFRV